MTDCPSLAELRSSLIGDLPEAETDIIFLHVETCKTCQASIENIESEPVDTIENAVRQSGVPQPLPPDCQRMILDSSLFIRSETPGDSALPTNDTWAPEETVRLIELIPGVDSIRDYLVRDRLGQGGMGTVYRATHRHLKRDVAIKVLKPRQQEHEQAIERFRKEMEAAGRLDHKNIVRAMDAGESDGTLYLVMEQIDGVDVSQFLGDGSLDVAEACEIARQAANGLAYAHSKNMVHRDIKPSNLMVTPDGVVKILDFGIATFETVSVNRAAIEHDAANRPIDETNNETLAGSLAYMAPEQCRGNRDVQSSADIFALGCTLYELLTGRRPFTLSGDILSQLQQRLESKPPSLSSESAASPSSLPKKLAHLVNRMLSVVPSERPNAIETAQQLAPFCHANHLRKIVREHTRSMPEMWQPNTVEFAPNRNHRWRTVIAALVMTSAVCCLVFWGVSNWKTNDGPATVSNSRQSQFFADMANVQFTPAAVTLRTEKLTIVVRHGFNMLIKSADGSTNVTSWNSLSLKIKYRDAYDIYSKHEETLRRINDQQIALYPHGTQSLEADLIVLELRQEQDGWVRYDAWTPDESVRLWIGPTKLAVASVSRNGMEIKSDVQSIDQLMDSKDFGHWVTDFLQESNARSSNGKRPSE